MRCHLLEQVTQLERPDPSACPSGEGSRTFECVRLAGLSGRGPTLTRMAGAAAARQSSAKDPPAPWAEYVRLTTGQLPPDWIDRGAGTLGVELGGEPSVAESDAGRLAGAYGLVEQLDDVLELIHVDIDHGCTTGAVARATYPEDGCRPVALAHTSTSDHSQMGVPSDAGRPFTDLPAPMNALGVGKSGYRSRHLLTVARETDRSSATSVGPTSCGTLECVMLASISST